MTLTAKTPAVGTVFPSVHVGSAGTSLPRDDVLRVVVDTHLHLPDMFEITFWDGELGKAADFGISVGVAVEIWAGALRDTQAEQLIVGEVTSVEGMFLAGAPNKTVVRGYTKDHRLQRTRRTRTFVNMTDSDIARQIAKDGGLELGEVQETRTTYDHVGQANQTDWDFLSWRARRVGFEIGVTDGKFHFREASSISGRPGEPPVDLAFQDALRAFQPRITGGNLSQEVEVRGWDSVATRSVTAKGPVATGSTKLDNETIDQTVDVFTSAQPPPPPPANNPALGNLGPAPSEKAHVVSLPLSSGPAADEVLRGVADGLGATFAEAVGEAFGDPGLHAGAVVEISAVPAQFAGRWTLTRARHVFDASEHGYRTHFEATGRQERSLLGLTSTGAGHATAPVVNGLVLGIVSNVLDEAKVGRVKVTLPWLSPQYESDWAPVVQFGAGARSGGLFLPEVGDQVLVGFEQGDPQRPFVLGGVLNKNSAFPKALGGAPTKSTNAAGDVVWRGIVSPSGNRLAFHDELPPGQGQQPPTASEVVLGTKAGNLAMAIDQVNGTVSLSCDPKPPDSRSAQGHLTISCGNAGAIDITTGTGGTVNIDGGAQLNLTAQAMVKIESGGVLELKGKQIKLN